GMGRKCICVERAIHACLLEVRDMPALLRANVSWVVLAWLAFAPTSAIPQPLPTQGNRTAQGSEANSFTTQLERAALDEMKKTGKPGAAIGIVSNGKIVFSKGLGHSSVEDESAVTSATLFRLGSTTKMFTAAALMKMALV